MFDQILTLDRIRGKEEFDELVELARKDTHGVFYPTHGIRKNGQRAGYFSIGAAGPVYIWSWLSTQHCTNKRDVLYLLNSVEGMVAAAGGDMLCAPMPKCSPFYDLISNPKSGYNNAGDYTFFTKKL